MLSAKVINMNNNKTVIHYIPVKYKKTWLSPCRISRAKKLVQRGEAIWFKDKLLGTCIRLKKEPQQTWSHKIDTRVSLGIDKGIFYDAFSVCSSVYHTSIQITHSLKLDERHFKKSSFEKAMYRKNRRYRLRFRIRKTNYKRFANNITYTAHYILQNFRNICSKLKEVFHIRSVLFEGTNYKSEHRRNRNIVILNPKFKEIMYNIFPVVTTTAGNTTKSYRDQLGLLKDDYKGNKNFFVHCVDSFVLGSRKFRTKLTHTHFILAERLPFIKRRQLTRERAKIREAKNYFRYRKGGIRENFRKMSKLKYSRYKPNLEKSNHLKNWVRHQTPQIECFKKFKDPFAGRFYRKNGERVGSPKYWNGQFYQYYNIEVY